MYHRLSPNPRSGRALLAVRNVGLVRVIGIAQQGAGWGHATAARRAGLAWLDTALFFVLIISCGGLTPFGVAH